MQPLKFGVLVLQDMPWQVLVKLWPRFETLGFDSTWVADHFVNYSNPTGPWFDGWSTLAAMASATSKIRIGSLVTSIGLRNPAVLARQAMTVDHISNGRLELGIGAGASSTIDPSYRMIGVEEGTPEDRSKRLREQVEIIDALLRNKSTSYKGEYYRIDGATMAPGPVQKPRPPLTIAAHTKASLEIAAKYADTWNSYGAEFGAPPHVVLEKTRKRCAILDRCCENIGRDPDSIGRSLLVFGEEANYAFASEEQFAEIVNRYTAIGINELIFFYPFFAPSQIDTFERIAKETIPKLRRA